MRRLGPPQEGKAGQKSAGSQKHASRCRCSAEVTEEVAGTRLCPGLEEGEPKRKNVPAGRAILETGPKEAAGPMSCGRPAGTKKLAEVGADDHSGSCGGPDNARPERGIRMRKTSLEFGRPGRAWQKRRQDQWLEDQQNPANKTCMECGRRGRACRIWGKCKARGKAEPWKATWPGQSGPG